MISKRGFLGFLFACALMVFVFTVTQPLMAQKKNKVKSVYAEKAFAQPVMEVGCWDPVWYVDGVPEYVFPMVFAKWKQPKHKDQLSVDQYASLIIDEIRRRPKSQPIWLFTYGWMGYYKPGWDQHNVVAYKDDATKEGTPTIWNDKGMAVWKARQVKLLERLKKAGCRLDCWPLDHEAWTNQWASNFGPDFSYRNMVLDERWKTKPILGLGITGSQLLDPERIKNEPVFTRKVSGFKKDPKDIRLAYEYVLVPSIISRNVLIDEVFAKPTLRYFPNITISDYGSLAHRKPLDWTVKDPNGFWGKGDIWHKLKKLVPSLKEIPGVGNTASPPLYGGKSARAKAKARNLPLVASILQDVEALITLYGSPEKFAPWITVPNYGTQGRDRNYTKSEYEELMTGLAKKGVRKFVLWNPTQISTREGNAEMISAFRKAHAILAKRNVQGSVYRPNASGGDVSRRVTKQ